MSIQIGEILEVEGGKYKVAPEESGCTGCSFEFEGFTACSSTPCGSPQPFILIEIEDTTDLEIEDDHRVC